VDTAEGAAIASAATTDIGAATGNTVHITGTTAITSFGNAPQAGVVRNLVFDGALTLTHHATNLILPGGANITTAAGDTCVAIAEDAAGAWRVHDYVKADGRAVSGGKVLQTVHTILQTPSSGNTVIPLDSTIPQNTEGTQIFSQAFTPKSATSKIIIKARLAVGADVALHVAAALFKDATADAIAVNNTTVASGTYMACLNLDFSEASGSTTARTYKVRIGCQSSANLWYLNQNSSGINFGGIVTSMFEITEVEA
jgi:hypothetical protein